MGCRRLMAKAASVVVSVLKRAEGKPEKKELCLTAQPGLKALAYTPAFAGAKHRERCWDMSPNP